MNENYPHPAVAQVAEEGILKGMYLVHAGGRGRVRVNLFGSGTILRDVLAAAGLLERDFGVPSDVFSVTSFSELRREALDADRWNLLHPGQPARVPYVQQCLAGRPGPFVAATDYMRIVPDQVQAVYPGPVRHAGHRRVRPQRLARGAARPFRRGPAHVVLAALKALADEGALDVATVTAAIGKLGIDPERPNPVTI